MIPSQANGWQDAATFLWNDGRSGVPPHRLFAGRLMGPAHQAHTLLLLVLVSTGVVWAQGRGRGPAGPPPTPRAAAPVDLTGYWVSIVTEDWRWRMVTPAKGDYASVPLNPEGRKVADGWTPPKTKPPANSAGPMVRPA